MTKYEAYGEIIKQPIVTYDIFNSFFGKFLGWGYSRYVFDYKPNKTYVVKIDYNARGSNFMENEIWTTVKETKFAKWFAPCDYISPDGKYLLQKKARPLTCHDKLPSKVPAFFTDIRYDNFGMYKNQVVCIDYALTNLLTKGLTNEMKSVKWNIPNYSCSKA